MPTELNSASVNLDGLMEVLSKNLYSSPAVAIRELVQNAHDACIRRKIEDNTDQDLCITLSPNANMQILTIEDNGSGLTYDEVKKYLATIGSGYTRVFRNSTENEDTIGYFGLGFLSSYVVASKVDVWTTSYQTPNETWHFSSAGGKRYSLNKAKNESIGTRVRLTLTEEYADLSSKDVLARITRKYCCLLPIPIHLKGDDVQLNSLTVPWRLGDDVSTLKKRKAELEFAGVFEDSFDPICTIAIPPSNELGVSGLMWVQDASSYSTSDFRNVSVFVRNMQITHEGRDLLPTWAGFIGCVVEASGLTPTASREDIRKDDFYYDVQDLLAHTLITGLQNIATGQSENWRRIVLRHNQALLGSAVEEPALFDVLADELKVPTSLGDKSVGALMESGNSTIYVRSDDKNNYEEVLYRARMLPIASGYMFAVSRFCEEYASRRGGKVVYLGTKESSQKLINKVNIDDAFRARVEAIFRPFKETVVFCEFEPRFVPLLIIEDKEAKLKQRIEDDETDKRIGSAALSLARLHTNTIEASSLRQVFVNMRSPLIEALASGSQEKDQALIEAMRAYMLTVSYDIGDDDIDFSDEVERFFTHLQKLAF